MTPRIASKPTRKRGRPRLESTTVVNVRLPISAYDLYCRVAFRSGKDVRTVLRRVLTHASELMCV